MTKKISVTDISDSERTAKEYLANIPQRNQSLPAV